MPIPERYWEITVASVGSSFTLMTFITSIILGLCMGSGALFSIRYGQKDEKGLQEDVCASFFFIALITFILTVISYIFLNQLSVFLHVPHEVWGDMKGYLIVIFTKKLTNNQCINNVITLLK